MNITWLCNKYASQKGNVPALSRLIELSSQRIPGLSEGRINLIIDEKLLLFDLISKLNEQVNIYKELNLHIGILSGEVSETLTLPEGKTIAIGTQEQLEQIKKIDRYFHISHTTKKNEVSLAYQRHHCINTNSESVSLGEIKSDPMKGEVLCRHYPACIYGLEAIRRQDSYNKKSKLAGLSIDEAATLSRYIGLSKTNKLTYYCTDIENICEETCELLACLIWYQLEGVLHAKVEDKISETTKSYIVETPVYDLPVEFIKGEITGRWWYIEPDKKEKRPCTQEDYESIRQGIMPDKWLSIDS